jgi:hypothetical protein
VTLSRRRLLWGRILTPLDARRIHGMMYVCTFTRYSAIKGIKIMALLQEYLLAKNTDRPIPSCSLCKDNLIILIFEILSKDNL